MGKQITATLLTLSLSALLACTERSPTSSESTPLEPATEQTAVAIDNHRLLHLDKEPGTWLTGGRDYQQSYFSPLTQIDEKNVDQLGYAWHYDTNFDQGYEATPIVVDGVLYGSGPTGSVFALDAVSGSEHWTFTPEIDQGFVRKVCCGVVNRGVAVWGDRVYVASLDGYLYALDRQDGSVGWRVDTFIDRERGYTITGAPYIANDLVIIGNAGAEFDARGYFTAYEADTGKQRWRFFTVPGDPERPQEHPELDAAVKTWDAASLWQVGLGGTVWDAMAFDPKLNLLYVGTGNAAPYPRKLRSPEGGDNLYLASILAIDPTTGKMAWHYQTTPGDNWDFTATQKMVLADLEIAGKTRQVIMQAPKNGFFYVLDRKTGELISAKPYAAVNWASHIDMATGRPVETGQGEYFNEPKLVFPGPQGAHNWQPMSYSPVTGLVYIPVKEAGAIWTMPEEAFEYQKGGLNSHSVYIFPTPGEWGLDSELAKSMPPIEELAAGQPDTTIRGFLRAWDPVSQELAWERETSGPWAGSMNAFWNGGGLMSSAGNLLFQGRGTGRFVVLNASTGEELHSIDVGASMMAAPMTYSIDGTQYVAILTGIGGGNGNDYVPGMASYTYGNTGRLVVFKLGGGEVPRRAELVHADTALTQPPLPRRGDATQLEHGGKLFLRNCAKCHANIDGRGSGIPDLKRMDETAHREFRDILLDGIRADRGMGNFSDLLSPEDVEALHVYLIDQAWQAWEKQAQAGEWHGAAL